MTYYEELEKERKKEDKKEDMYRKYAIPVGAMLVFGAGYFVRGIMRFSSLNKEEEEKLTKEVATRMLNRALSGKLKHPYDEDEIAFIKETLGIEVPSK